MRKWALGIVAATTLPISATADAQETAVRFREFPLGMTLEDFLARAPMTGNTDVICTNAVPGDWDIISTEQSKVGVVGCLYSHQIRPQLREPSDRYMWEKQVPLSPTVDASVRFYFFENKLYRVVLMASARKAQELEDALVEKWGSPTRVLAEKYPVKSGVFDIRLVAGFEKYWVKPSGVISMTYPYLLEDKVAVTYNDSGAVKKINDKIVAR